MTRKIFKYPFPIQRRFQLVLPFSARIVHIGLDPEGTPCLWAEFDLEKQGGVSEARPFFCVGTGHPVPEEANEHLGSFVQETFIWHIYD